MTTIAYRDGVLAADRRSTSSKTIVYDREVKLLLDEDRTAAYAFTGLMHKGLAAVHALIDKGELELTKGDDGIDIYRLEVVEGRPRLTVYEEGYPVHYDNPGPMATGSGMAAALGAMHAGADAVSAVEVASKVDIHTGGGVDYVEWDHQKQMFELIRA